MDGAEDLPPRGAGRGAARDRGRRLRDLVRRPGADRPAWASLAPIVMSMTTFAGSAQFAAISILDAGGTVATAVTAAVLLNARYGPIGAQRGAVADGRSRSRGSCTRSSWWTRPGPWPPRATGRFDPARAGGRRRHAVRRVGRRHGGGRLVRRRAGRPRRRGGWTPRSPRSSWRCSSRSCGSRAAWSAAGVGAAIALALTPFTPPGRADRVRQRGMPPGTAAPTSGRGRGRVSDVWLVVLLCGLATMAIKAAGPVLLGRPRASAAARVGDRACWARRCWRRWWRSTRSAPGGR